MGKGTVNSQKFTANTFTAKSCKFSVPPNLKSHCELERSLQHAPELSLPGCGSSKGDLLVHGRLDVGFRDLDELLGLTFCNLSEGVSTLSRYLHTPHSKINHEIHLHSKINHAKVQGAKNTPKYTLY